MKKVNIKRKHEEVFDVYEKDFKFEKKEVKKNWIDKMCRTMEKIGLTIRNSLIVLLSIVFVAVLVWFANIR